MLNDVHVLERHRLFSSDDYVEIKQKVSRHLCPHEFDVLSNEPVRTRMNGLFIGDVALLDLHYDAPVSISVDDLQDHYLFRVTVQGRCEVRHGDRHAALRSGGMSISSPFARSTITTDGHCRNILLRIRREPLAAQLQALLKRSVREPLIFDVSVDPAHPGVSVVHHALAYLCRIHEAGVKGSHIASGLSDHVLQVLLTQLPHNHSEKVRDGGQTPLPRHVKLARDYIEAHLDGHITLAHLCNLTGVSIRTLQNGFNRFLQQSPLDYIRDRRLAAVHAALKQAGPGQTVTDLLLRHGISSFGHFSSAYRQRYGCVPSVTLRHHT